MKSLSRQLGWVLGSGTVLQGFNSSMIAVALVSIGAHFGETAALPWLVSGMYIACAVASPAMGRLVDLFGARRLYAAGLAVVLLTAIAGPFAPSAGWLVADRVLMGIGASVHFPAAMVLVRRLAGTPGEGQRRSMGTIALCGQTVAAIGPSVGGVLVSAFGWQSIFWVNLPLVLNSAVWLYATVPKDPPLGRRQGLLGRLDLPGLVLFTAALTLLMAGLLRLGQAGSLLPVVLSLPCWAAFLLRERRAATPFVDVRLLLRHRGVLTTCGRAVLTFIGFYAVFYGLPQWFETTRGLGSAQAGLLMMPIFGTGVLSTMAATFAGRILQPRALLIIGGVTTVIAGMSMALVLRDDAAWWTMIVVGALLGVPNGFNNLGNQGELHAAAPTAALGIASGLYRTAQYVGAALSAAAVTLLLVPAAAHGGAVSLGLVIAGIGGVLALLNTVAIVRGRRRFE
ncbi:MFS transporter [Actinoplanes derwentensis]|uniref:Major Facilitator Superfamily protein n=1 Tax=Actinoplanes derwentensis TaxID=113562 RepID=A0A1H1ZSW9_9ACTN|nr:MFS transporter [Actinoplanes derwentensis]GID89180.1 MFS transporter [Actinoplanes derwentensis]SDT36376.1 Major Facilitator Superfamily protein [Actinoplanes derwentensis]